MLQLFVGIPYLLLAFLLANLSAVYSRFSGSYPKAVENLYCKLLLRVKHYISFGLDEVVIDIMQGDSERHIAALVSILNGASNEYTGLAFFTLQTCFPNSNTRRVLEIFVENLTSEEEKARYRRLMV
ncbi:hypothetical protein K9N68_13505 [Kovacikia minuta CCNUW1]|uniref:hypothetical protein n=1 Tax=Kovacikia minuta TaxID=2931930 RepID=UPI001CCF68FE|nr:hypothetical protein [Kovacikia minuta]UBF28766.1 hypothetical protein K9N68_13505 [Kovacikia minuta CCNUW1]